MLAEFSMQILQGKEAQTDLTWAGKLPFTFSTVHLGMQKKSMHICQSYHKNKKAPWTMVDSANNIVLVTAVWVSSPKSCYNNAQMWIRPI